MRAAGCILFLCAAAVADWAATRTEFRKAYNKDAGALERVAAIERVAEADVPGAAALLYEIWRDLEVLTKAQRRLREKTLKKLRSLDTKDRLDGFYLPAQEERAGLRKAASRYAKKLTGYEKEQAAVLDGLRSMKSTKVLEWMASTGLRTAKSPLLLQTVAVHVANRAGTEALLKALEHATKAEQIVPLLRAVGKRPDDNRDAALKALLFRLSHADAAVRIAAAQALARLGHKDSVGPLIEALGRESEESRTFRRLVQALQILTGQRIGAHLDVWQRWWRENQGEVKAGALPLGQGKPVTAGDAAGGVFYGIPQTEDRIIYILDISGSMDVSMDKPKWVEGRAVPADPPETSRLATAKKELLRAVKNLRKGRLYAVILYSDGVYPVHEKLVPATEANYDKLVAELENLEPGGSTNTYDAIDYALRMAGVHPDIPKTARKTEAIYLVSDGAPTNSDGKPQGEAKRTLLAVENWNALKRVTIHTIGIGRQHSAGFMRALAAQSDGTYRAVTPKRKWKRKR